MKESDRHTFPGVPSEGGSVLLPSGTVSTELSVEVQSLPSPLGEVSSDHDWRDMESESDTDIDESF
jgi:hypothetical protein